jgi:signal transduction histidine kinase
MNSKVQAEKNGTKLAVKEVDDSFLTARSTIIRFAIIALVSLTAFSIIAVSWTYWREQTLVEGLATKEAKANFNKDLSFRKWATMHGGVYVPPNKRTPPNPALAHLPHRDLITTDGKKLTLMNPAYMMRQMTEEFEQFYGVKGSITGLVLLNPPINAPDKWEKKILNRFEVDSSEVIEIIDIDGEPFLRLMRPMFMTKGCVKCHGFLGFKDGDLRGGISVSIPLAPYIVEARNVSIIMAITISVLWVFGVFGIFRHTKSRLALVNTVTQHTGELRAEIATRIQAEHALTKLTQELEERVVERTKELETSNKELESFSYTVSHDLRTPLRVIDGNSEILMQICAEKLSVDEMEYLKHLQDGGRKMNEMISGLLKLSRNINCEMDRQQMDLSQLADGVYQQFAMTDPQRQVEWELEGKISAKCDSALIKVVLENLIGNAWKYSAKTQKAHIKFGSFNKDGEEIFYVKDNGAGCDMSDAQKLFLPFKRLHTSEDFAGDGIGLATVQRIINRHGGRVWAESVVGVGTTLFFTL